MLIAISGKIGSGKDTLASIIKEELVSAEIKKFAYKLKQMTALLIGCSIDQLEDQDFKSKELDEMWRVWFNIGTGKKHDGIFKGLRMPGIFATKQEADLSINNGDLETSSELLTPRLIMQLLGTECGREIIHPNLWVNSLFVDYSIEKDWIITDCRFENEASAVKDRGGKLIRIERDGIRKINHPSETSLDNYKDWDLVIHNNGTIDDLRKSWYEKRKS